MVDTKPFLWNNYEHKAPDTNIAGKEREVLLASLSAMSLLAPQVGYPSPTSGVEAGVCGAGPGQAGWGGVGPAYQHPPHPYSLAADTRHVPAGETAAFHADYSRLSQYPPEGLYTHPPHGEYPSPHHSAVRP